MIAVVAGFHYDIVSCEARPRPVTAVDSSACGCGNVIELITILDQRQCLGRNCMHSIRRSLCAVVCTCVCLSVMNVSHAKMAELIEMSYRVWSQYQVTMPSLARAWSPLGSGKSGPKDQVALHYYYTSPSHWCTTHEVSKL